MYDASVRYLASFGEKYFSCDVKLTTDLQVVVPLYCISSIDHLAHLIWRRKAKMLLHVAREESSITRSTGQGT